MIARIAINLEDMILEFIRSRTVAISDLKLICRRGNLNALLAVNGVREDCSVCDRSLVEFPIADSAGYGSDVDQLWLAD